MKKVTIMKTFGFLIVMCLSVLGIHLTAQAEGYNFGSHAEGKNVLIVNRGESVTVKVATDRQDIQYEYSWTTMRERIEGQTTSTCTLSNITKNTTLMCSVRELGGDHEVSDMVVWKIYVKEEVMDKYQLDENNVYFVVTSDDYPISIREMLRSDSKVKALYVPLEQEEEIQVIAKVYPNVTMIIYADVDLDWLNDEVPLVDLETTAIGENYKYAYPYTKQIGTFDGHLRFASFRVNPGEFLYDATIAQQVLGTSDATEIQAMISTPEKFIQVADKMKAAGYYMTSGAAENHSANTGLLYQFTEYRNHGVAPNSVSAMRNLARDIITGGYDTNNMTWTDGWQSDLRSEKVFGWFATTWLHPFVIPVPELNHKFAICQAPFGYAWGGVYASITKSGKNTNVAIDFLNKAISEEAMYEDAKETQNMPNNARVVNRLIQENVGYATYLENSKDVLKIRDAAARSIYGGNYALPADCTYVKPTDNGGNSTGNNTQQPNQNNSQMPNGTPAYITQASVVSANGFTISTKADGTATVSKVNKNDKKVVFDNAVVASTNYKVTAVNKDALKGSKATQVVFGKYVKSIGAKVFNGAKVKTIVIQSAGVVKINKKAFSGSKVKTKKMTIKVNKEMSKANYNALKKALKKAKFNGKIKKIKV